MIQISPGLKEIAKKAYDSLESLVYDDDYGKIDAARIDAKNIDMIAFFIREALAARTGQAAALVAGWHIKKGGYTELAEQIRALETR